MRALAALALLLAAPAHADMPAQAMIELTLRGQRIEGTPLHFSSREVQLLGRDGRLWQFPPSEAADFHKSADSFRPYSVSEFRAALLRELGRGFEVTGTAHYLVAHRQGQRDIWAQRFEDLYRSFVHYWAVRGLTPRDPPFPLVAVVCRNRAEFDALSARNGLPMHAGILGYYEFASNRIILYDMGVPSASEWQSSASVLIHEATHQSAYNTGVQSRYTRPPTWVSEGLATMFEAPGVYDSRNHTQQAARINRGRLDVFRKVVPHHSVQLLQRIIVTDDLFALDPALAYAEAWALTFYLVETQPRKYAEYMTHIGACPPFTRYTAEKRSEDFQTYFGTDLRMLEARLLRFIANLK